MSEMFPPGFWEENHRKALEFQASIDASAAKKGADEFDEAAERIKKSQEKIKGTTKVTTEFDTRGLNKLEEELRKMVNKLDTILGSIGKNMGSSFGINLDKAFNSSNVTKAINGIGTRVKTTIAESMVAGTKQARGELAQNIKALQKSVVDPLNEMLNFRNVNSELGKIINSDAMRRYSDVIDKMSGDRLVDNLKSSLSVLRDLSLRDKRMLGLLNQDSYNLSEKGSMQVASDLKKQGEDKNKLLKSYYDARTKESKANTKYIENQEKREQRAEERELNKEAEKRNKAEQQRLVRQQLYQENVRTAIANVRETTASTGGYKQKTLTDEYNRAVARIRGIYQSAVVHGRVENPETIQAGINELQKRSLALNNYRLESQMGIQAINDRLKTTVQRLEDMGVRWNKISSVIQNSVQMFSTIQSFATKITSTLTNFARTGLNRVFSTVRSLVTDATTAYQSLEVSLIGFKNFFGEESSERLYQQIKTIAAQAPGLGTTDLADYVRQIAPVSGHNADLALNASLGMLKTIQYGGASGSTEMEYVIKNIRDVISKGTATAIDIRQFNRAMPILEEVLGSVNQSQLLQDGVLTINPDNVDTILAAFAELNTSQTSAVAGIFDQVNKTLSGQWEQFQEQFTTNLMEMFRSSGVYAGAQSFLMQINEGGYVQDALIRLGKAISNFINKINWFKVQRVAGEFWDGMKIIWEGIKDAISTIQEALGGTNTGKVMNSFTSFVADIIRGLSIGVAQVIKFLKYLEGTGLLNKVGVAIGWFGSVGAMLTQLFGTMLSHITNIIGNALQLVSRLQEFRIKNTLNELQAQLDAIPVSARSQIISGELLSGTGATSTATAETTAINNLTKVVNSHLLKIESNQLQGEVADLPTVETVLNNGQRYVYSSDYQGYPAIGTWDKKTGQYNWSGYSNRDTAYSQYQKLTTQNRLQSSNSVLLQKIGNNKIVDRTLKWMKSAGQKLLSFMQNLMGGLLRGGITLLFTEAISGIIESLNMFGENTTMVAGMVKTAGYAITGALVGSSVGGAAGGVVGALVGLGVGIASLVKTIKEKEAELANDEITESLDSAEQAMYDQTVSLLQEYEIPVDKESIVGKGALQQLAYYIKSTPVANRSTEEAVKYYSEAYKMLSVGYGLQDYIEGSQYTALGGTELDLSDTSNEYFKNLAALIRKYGLAEGQGYYYGEGVDGFSYYTDEALTDQVPAEELLQKVFPNGATDVQANALLERANELDKSYGESTSSKLQALIDNDIVFKDKLTTIDQNVLGILQNITSFLGKANPENLGRVYGSRAKSQAESFEAHANGWERFQWLTSGSLWTDEAYRYTNEGYGSERGADKIYYNNVRSKLGAEYQSAQDEGDSERAAYLLNWIEAIDQYEFGNGSGWFSEWAAYILHKLAEYNDKFNSNFRFATGGLVPAISALGVDTVPAMLSPGEFVMKPSVVKKAGLGVMHALNRGDLGAAARSLAQNVSNKTWNRNDTSTINNHTTNYNTNNFRILNRNTSARMNSYYSLANRMRF